MYQYVALLKQAQARKDTEQFFIPVVNLVNAHK